MKRPRFRLSTLLAVSGLAVVCAVIPAAAQVAGSSRDSNNGDNGSSQGDGDRQPYYVNGVEYRPYTPEHRNTKAASSAAPQNSAPAADEEQAASPALHPFVPAAAPVSSTVAEEADDDSASVGASHSQASASSASDGPLKRPRYAVAIIQALDKVTAETIRFEAPIGKPIRYKGLIYTARACETTAPDEAVPDTMAYLEVRTNPAPATSNAPATRSREIFHGWSYASSPSLNPIEHPNYDAWVVGCRQPLPGV